MIKLFKKGSKKDKPLKQPTLFRKLVEVYYEEALKRRAMRLLSKEIWGVEFLEYLCLKCAKAEHKPVEMYITDRNGRKFVMRSREEMHKETPDEDILMHLDDTAYVNDFIRRHSN